MSELADKKTSNVILLYRKLIDGRWLPLLGGFFVFALALVSPVSYAGSDSHFALLVSQAMLEHHTLALDEYREVAPNQFATFAYQLYDDGKHVYYSYPIGTSVFALPFVLLANLLGLQMVNATHNYLLQNWLSAWLCATAFWLIYKIGCCYLERRASLLIATISVLGTPLISTMGTALWNMDLTVVFVLASLYFVVRYDSGAVETIPAYRLGVLLFAAYFCRPTAALFIVWVLFYVLFRARAALVPLVGTVTFFCVGFVGFSWVQYGQLQPPYYSASNWVSLTHPLTALEGLLISPSRGLFVYSPFLALVLLGGLWVCRRQLLWWSSLGWFLTHLCVVASTEMWWGGYSFGPRLLTDVVPALVLMTIWFWQALSFGVPRWHKRGAMAYLALGAFAIWVNSYQGLWNINTVLWNAMPNIDQHPAYIFDWAHPQLLISAEGLHERHYEHVRDQLSHGERTVEPYTFGHSITSEQNEQSVLFFGWWRAASGTLWSEITWPKILFHAAMVDTTPPYTLEMTAGALAIQPITVYLNGTEIGEMRFEGAQTTQKLTFNGTLLKPDSINQLELKVPGSQTPPLSEIQRLGLSAYLHKLGLAFGPST